MSQLTETLLRHKHLFHTVIPTSLQQAKTLILDLNQPLESYDIDIENPEALVKRTQELLKKNNAQLAVGRYAENRTIYKDRAHFQGVERSIHLGIDLMVPPQTPIYTPLDATIHSFKDNIEIGDYGPTIILQHTLDNLTFYTLYGHLTRDSLQKIACKQVLNKGVQFSRVGEIYENGKWPPHLHFQIITDIGKYKGDFPGVCRACDKEKFLALCLDPNYILNLKS